MKQTLAIAAFFFTGIPFLAQAQNVHSMDLIPAPPPGPPSFPVILTDIQMVRSLDVSVVKMPSAPASSPFTNGTWIYYPPSVELGDQTALPVSALIQTYVVYDVRGTWIKIYKDFDAWIDTSHLNGLWYRPVPQP